MKKTIDVKTVRDGLWMDTNVTYAQVPGWLGNTTRDLKLTVIRHFQNDSDKRYPVIFWFAGGGWILIIMFTYLTWLILPTMVIF